MWHRLFSGASSALCTACIADTAAGRMQCRTLTLIVIVKYLLIVLECDDKGEGENVLDDAGLLSAPADVLLCAGGTFAMFSLLCRYTSITPGVSTPLAVNQAARI